MVEGYGALSGPGNQQIYIQVYWEGQDWGGNFNRYRGQVVYKGNGYGSFANSVDQYWSANLGGHTFSGSFRITSPGTGDIWLLNTTFDIYADGNGYGPDFWSSASIDTSHASIGDGSVSVLEQHHPRIPKRPSPPGVPTFSEVGPTSVRVSWSGSPDDAGSGIDAYLLRYRDADPFNGAGYIDHSQENNLTRLVTGLQPGKRYWFGVYAHNGAADNGGYSNPSGQAVVETLSGFRAWWSGLWKNTRNTVWNGLTWQKVRLREWDGTTWRNTR